MSEASRRQGSTTAGSARVPVAGIGNPFLGDDGFGPELVGLPGDGDPPPPGVMVVDNGLLSLHQAYDLLDAYDMLVPVDALPGGRDRAGRVAVPEATADDCGGESDAHGMNPTAMPAETERS